MILVIDASVAAKWFLAEPDHEAALALQQSGNVFIAPDLIVAEVMSAAWKYYRRGAIRQDQALQIGVALPKWFAQLEPLDLFAARAFEISVILDHPVYDSFYIALGEREGAELVTADQRLILKTRGTQFAANVRPLITP